MPSRYAESDPYTYEGSPVLINRAGIRDQEALDAFERMCTLKRMLTNPPEGILDYEHFKAMHHHLFQDVYDWAGKERNVPISKGGNRFATPTYIHELAVKLFTELRNENWLSDADEQHFASRAAYYVCELNVLHPFRDGNGRVSRWYFLLLAEQAGFDLKPDVLEVGWLDACISCFSGDESSMERLLRKALAPLPLASS